MCRCCCVIFSLCLGTCFKLIFLRFRSRLCFFESNMLRSHGIHRKKIFFSFFFFSDFALYTSCVCLKSPNTHEPRYAHRRVHTKINSTSKEKKTTTIWKNYSSFVCVYFFIRSCYVFFSLTRSAVRCVFSSKYRSGFWFLDSLETASNVSTHLYRRKNRAFTVCKADWRALKVEASKCNKRATKTTDHIHNTHQNESRPEPTEHDEHTKYREREKKSSISSEKKNRTQLV